MEQNSLNARSPLGLDTGDWQEVTIWALATYGFLQFLAMNGRPALENIGNKAKAGKEFGATYLIPQAEVKSFEIEDFDWIGSLESTLERSGQAKPKAAKPKKMTLVNEPLKQVVEMAYWLVKWVGDYEKLAKRSYEKEFVVTKGDFEDGTTIMHKNVRAVIAFSRYLVKYVTSFEKLYNMANKDA